MNTSISSYFPGKFLQFVADNVDHNTRTLDGHGSFHGMGIIACTTPGSNVSLPIPRARITVSELSEIGKITLRYFTEHDNSTEEKELFVDLDENSQLVRADTENDLFDLFSKLIWPLKEQRPSWSGFMQLYNKEEHDPGKASITFLPMIDMSPSDLTCINSTLHFVCQQSNKYGVTPVLTFDQPLYQKATQIVAMAEVSSPLKKTVLRLGAFHTQMSFLGTIGHIMSGSGLEELLQVVYAPNAVTHMMSGKAVSRATRGHFLVDSALHALLISKICPAAIPESVSEVNSGSAADKEKGADEVIPDDEIVDETDDSNNMLVDSSPVLDIDRLTHLAMMYEQLEEKNINKKGICSNDCLKEVDQKINELREKLRNHRTATL